MSACRCAAATFCNALTTCTSSPNNVWAITPALPSGAINSRYVGKMYFSPGMGYQYRISQKLGLTASFNYILQKVDLEHYNRDKQLYHTESLSIDLIAFKVGLILY